MYTQWCAKSTPSPITGTVSLAVYPHKYKKIVQIVLSSYKAVIVLQQ